MVVLTTAKGNGGVHFAIGVVVLEEQIRIEIGQVWTLDHWKKWNGRRVSSIDSMRLCFTVLTFTDRLLSIPLAVSIAEHYRLRIGHVVRVALIRNLRIIAEIWILHYFGCVRYFARICAGDY